MWTRPWLLLSLGNITSKLASAVLTQDLHNHSRCRPLVVSAFLLPSLLLVMGCDDTHRPADQESPCEFGDHCAVFELRLGPPSKGTSDDEEIWDPRIDALSPIVNGVQIEVRNLSGGDKEASLAGDWRLISASDHPAYIIECRARSVPEGVVYDFATEFGCLPPELASEWSPWEFQPPTADDFLVTLEITWFTKVIVLQLEGLPDYQEPQLAVIDESGSYRYILTEDEEPRFQPALSPDGTRIVFLGDSGYEYGSMRTNLWITDIDGRNLIRLTDAYRDDSSPCWSPDGSRIAFVSQRAGSFEIMVINPDGSGEQNLTMTSDANEFDPTMSPDGAMIAFVRKWHGNLTVSEICLMESDGSNVQQIAEGSPAGGGSTAGFLTWSPGGHCFVFVGTYGDLFLIDSDGSNLRNLTNEGWEATWRKPCWSPDGQQIAAQRIFQQEGSTRKEIFVLDVSGSGMTQLTHDSPLIPDYPDWGPLYPDR